VRHPIMILAITGIALLPVQTSSVDRAQDEATLREIKEVLWPRAYLEQDTELLDRLLAPEFQMIDDEGVWSTKADQMKRVETSKPPYDSLVFSIRRLDIFENGTAIVAGSGTIHGTDDDGPYVAEYQSSNVLIKRDGTWKAVASHVSGYTRKRQAAVR